MTPSDPNELGATFSWPLSSLRAGGPDFLCEDPAVATTDLIIREVARARCFAFVPEKPNGGAVLVLAGGGYTKLVIGKEGVEIANWLTQLGFHAFVLVHRFPCAAFGAQAPVDDAREAMRQIRARASSFGFDTIRVGALGLSSGGHLASCLISAYPAHWAPPASQFASFSTRPDFLIVGYGPISTNAVGRTIIADKSALAPPEKQALYDAMQPDAHLQEDASPAFLVYAADDPIVPVENGRRLHAALEAKGVSAELHVFASAPHGFALREKELPVGAWPSLCAAWLRQGGLLQS